MGTAGTLRRVVVAVVVLASSTVASATASADGLPSSTTTAAPPPPSTTTTTTTTIAPTTTSTTTMPAATTAPTTTAPTTTPAHTGVPQVPTGGGPTTTVAPGTPTTVPPVVDLGPAIDAISADVDQLAAISTYASAAGAVPIAAAREAAASATLGAAHSTQRRTAAAVTFALRRLGGARHALADLALAAYTGEAHAVPGAAHAAAPDGTVSSAATADPSDSQVAAVLLGVAVEHTRRAYAVAQSGVTAAERLDAAAGAQVAGATEAASAATDGVTSARATLLAATQAATVPGLAHAHAAATQLASSRSQPVVAHPRGGPAPSSPRASAQGSTAASGEGLAPGGPSILGPPVASAAELAAWYATTRMAATTTVAMPTLAADYLLAGTATGVRADLAFVQSVIETGYFTFPSGGQLTGADNNFAGIGACDSCSHGWSFPDALTGVTAQLQLLEAYASPGTVPTPLIGPVGVGGCCTTWTALAGKWASNPLYGQEILSLFHQLLDWIVPQRLLAAGLPAPAGTVPAPPGTEPAVPAGPVTAPSTSASPLDASSMAPG